MGVRKVYVVDPDGRERVSGSESCGDGSAEVTASEDELSRRLAAECVAETVSDSSVGLPLGLNIVPVDVEQALQKSEERYKALFASITEGFYLADIVRDDSGVPCDYRYVEVNSAFERIMGLSRDEFIGKRYTELEPDAEAQEWLKTFVQIALTGTPHHRTFYWEAADRYFDTIAYRPTQGQFAAVFTDVTERKRAEEALRKGEERLRLALNGAKMGLWEWDFAKGRILADDRIRTIMGLAPDVDLSIDLFESLVHPADLQRVRAALYASSNEKTAHQIDCRIVRHDGGERWISIHGFTIGDSDGNPARIVGVFWNCSPFKRAGEKLEILSETAGQLLASDEPQRVVQSLCESVMAYLKCDAFFNFLVDEPSGRLRLNACAGVSDETARAMEWLDSGAPVCECPACHGTPTVCENILETSDPGHQHVRSCGTQACVCYPLLGRGGRVIGILLFGKRSERLFKPECLSMLKTVADQVGIALERACLLETERQAVREAQRQEREIALARAEAELRAAELHSFMASMADGVSLTDAQGKVLWMNDAGRAIFGVPPEEKFEQWMSRYQRLKLDGEPLPVEESVVYRALSGESIRDFRYRVISPLGKEVVVGVSISPVKDPGGNVIGTASVIRDVTENADVERQKDELYEREHRISKALQSSLVPETICDMPGYEIAVKYEARLHEAEVGGDFYDVFELGDGKYGILIGDVEGKGLSAAMRVGAVRHTIRGYAYLDPRPSRVMVRTNKALCRDLSEENSMVTALFAVIDTRIGALTYANAGHEPPFVLTAGGAVEELNGGGPVLGIDESALYVELSRSIQPGEVVVLLTDGITEARCNGSELFGVEGVMDCIERSGDADSPEQIATAILESAKAYGGGALSDDAAIVVLRLSRPG